MAEQAATRLETRERIGFVGQPLRAAGGGPRPRRRLPAPAGLLRRRPRAARRLRRGDRARRGPDGAGHAGDARARSRPTCSRTLGRALERIGPAPRPGEPESAADLRPKLLWWLAVYGRRSGDQGLRAGELAKAYLADPGRVDPGLSRRRPRDRRRHRRRSRALRRRSASGWRPPRCPSSACGCSRRWAASATPPWSEEALSPARA